MRARALALSLSLLLIASAVVAQPWRYVVYEQFTIDNSADQFTAATINEGSGHPAATLGICKLVTAEIRYRLDGTAPTTTVGDVWSVNETKTIVGNDLLNNFRGIRTGATSGELNCHFFAQ
ncbi:MAG TPA: hypothetical protein VEC57_15100 [Candidatus Limnocylindrales bacterium]|nr:hypothetical protein [Candidatus Limnocylindrales bacterium]